MIIKKLELINFRNYEKLDVTFSKDINIFYGNNAQGKTNVLEALYIGCTTKSQKGSKEKEIIRFGEEEAHIRMYVEKNGLERRIDMHLKKSKSKGVAIDGIPVTRAADIYGLLNIISFSPDDLSMIKNGPADRRRFMDMELCQLDKTYLYNLSAYNKALNQKNELLKQIKDNSELKSTLQIWDDQLVKFGTYVISRRRKFIDELKKIACSIHEKITEDGERLNIKYMPDSSEEDLDINIFNSRERDIFLRMSNVGPQRDDMIFLINGEDARKYGSRGQQRTVALSLKLAEIELVRSTVHDNPVLLLDDVLSELDRDRQTQLLNSISNIQTFITCTGLEEFVNDRIKKEKVYRVADNSVYEETTTAGITDGGM